MSPAKPIGRRQFLRGAAYSLGAARVTANASLLEERGALSLQSATPGGPQPDSSAVKMQANFGSTDTVWILSRPGSSLPERLAFREIARGLRKLGLTREPIQADEGSVRSAGRDLVFSLGVNKQAFKHPEAYEITQENQAGKARSVRLTGCTPQAVLYAVFGFLERQGAFFGLDGEAYPLDPSHTLNLPATGTAWIAQPRFGVRGLVPWPDFLNCVTIYNREDWRSYLEAMVRMRFNTLARAARLLRRIVPLL